MKKILFVASEARPFAASGGLGDVIGSLPPALADGGDLDVRAVMPLYGSIPAQYREKMKYLCNFYVQLSWRSQYCGVFEYEYKGVKYYFLDNEYYFKREMLYGSYDDGDRFAFFSKAVLDMFAHIGWVPDILHANDWQSALTVIYHKCRGYYPEMKTVYTIHNLEYQGRYGTELLGDIFDLPPESENVVRYGGDINLTKGAIVCCDALTTVSPQYAAELRTEYFAQGLDGIINENAYKLRGIVNGIDTEYYNPRGEGLAVRFDADSMAGKTRNKTALQKELGLPERKDVPVISMISRLASHKGFDLVKRVIDDVMKADVQFVLLGTGEREYEDFFRALGQRYPDKTSINIAFDKDLAKRIYASSDMFLMPSRSEPCGLAQMIASAYGTVPIVRETGGLYDTIKPFDEYNGTGNGITFATYNAHDMLDAIWRAVGLYADKSKWDTLRKNAMKCDFSWNASARKYIELYSTL